MSAMRTPELVLHGTRRGTWALFALAVILADLIVVELLAGMSVSKIYATFTALVLFSTTRRLLQGPCELRLYADRFEVHRRSKRIARSFWTRIEHFKTSALTGRVGFVYDPSRFDASRHAAGRSPLERAWHEAMRRLTGIDGDLQSRYREMSNQQLAAFMNGRLEQSRQPVADPLANINYETKPPQLGVLPEATGRFLGENWVLNLLADQEHRVRIEDALGILGSLAGFSVIAALREMAGSRAALQRAGMAVMSATDGSEYYFGDVLNTFLLEDPAESVFAQVTAPLRQAGKPVPDPLPIVKRVASTVGSDKFGIPDLPPEHRVDDNAVNIAKVMWPHAYRAAALDRLSPQTWTNTFLHAIRVLNEKSPGILDDTMRARIVLECAFPASHLDPETIQSKAA